MEFRDFKRSMQDHLDKMFEGQTVLFVVDVDKDTLWETYLDSFPPGTNEIFRKRREMDCSCCRSFIRSFGNVVTIVDNCLVSIWGFEVGDQFGPVVQVLNELVLTAPVRDVFITRESAFGTDKSRELLEEGVYTWEHFRVNLPKRFIYDGSSGTNAAYTGKLRDIRNVFKRSLEEITSEAVITVLDLIAEKMLYRGEEWQGALQKFLELHEEYQDLPKTQKENYCWSKSVEIGGSVGKIRNHSIGVLLQDLSAGVNVEAAIKKYEAIVAPSNYKRPKAIFTKKMVEAAQAKVAELGLLDSLGRRYAALADITVNNVLWANRDAQQHMGGASGVFEMLKQEVAIDPTSYKGLPGTNIEEFLAEILPRASTIEVLFENHHQANLMSLISPQNSKAPTMFKWDNPFSWAYNGNIADSMKQRVKAAGGKIDGILRFSIQWNEEIDNPNDFDAHCVEPSGNLIFYRNNGRIHPSSGILDVDIIEPGNKPAVENITWTNLHRMPQGRYEFLVHNYTHRGGTSGFSAEIEFEDQIFEYEYRKNVQDNAKIKVAHVLFDGEKFTIEHMLPSSTSSRQVWGLNTNQFHPVSTMLYSPNYWDGQKGVGHRHFFFMLAGCKNPDRPNGFFNEYLREDLLQHKRVFEALGSKMKVDQSDEQLSGLGFSSTKRNSLIVKANGQMVKVIF